MYVKHLILFFFRNFYCYNTACVEIVYADPAEKELKLRLFISISCFSFQALMLGQSYSVSQFIVVYYWSTDLLAQLKKNFKN